MTVLQLHLPTLEEMAFRQALLADPETMAYNLPWGGAIGFGPERWRAWYRRWVSPGEEGRFYRYLWSPEENAFVGEVAWHREEGTGYAMVDVIVHARYRGKGYGGQGLELLSRAAARCGLEALYDRLDPGRPAIPLFVRHGFLEVSRNEDGILFRKAINEGGRTL